MKKIRIVLFLSFLIFISLNAMGMQPVDKNPRPPKHGTVGAPLDGGLLAVLGAAGIAYYVSRKKKKGLGD